MKKTLLALVALFSISVLSYGQTCTPDPLYMDSTFGAWPDTIENFVSGQVGVPYVQILDFKLPNDAGEIDPTYSGVPVDSAVLTDVTGLPPGLTYTCNVSSCTWYGGQQGCASLDGTPTTAGTYDIVIELDGWVTVFWSPVSQPVTFTGYKIDVSPAMDITLYHQDEFSISQNSPNPFSEETTIKFRTGHSGDVSFQIMDLLGNRVYAKEISAVPGDNTFRFTNSGLADGVYIYTLSNGKKSITRKMTVRR